MQIDPILFRVLLLSHQLQAIVSIDLSNILSRLLEAIIGLKIARVVNLNR